MQVKRHAFISLYEAASQNTWCWNLACTTCGHGDFRVGFSKIIHGQHFDDDSFWPNGKSAGSLFKGLNTFNNFLHIIRVQSINSSLLL